MSEITCKYCGATSATYKQVGPHIGEYCASCQKWIRWVPRKEHFKKEEGTITSKIIDAQLIKDEARRYYEEELEDELPWD